MRPFWVFILAPLLFFFFNHTPTTEIYTLSLHDGSSDLQVQIRRAIARRPVPIQLRLLGLREHVEAQPRSEEHTSELQSRQYLVCRLLLEKKKILLRIAKYIRDVSADVRDHQSGPDDRRG